MTNGGTGEVFLSLCNALSCPVCVRAEAFRYGRAIGVSSPTQALLLTGGAEDWKSNQRKLNRFRALIRNTPSRRSHRLRWVGSRRSWKPGRGRHDSTTPGASELILTAQSGHTHARTNVVATLSRSQSRRLRIVARFDVQQEVNHRQLSAASGRGCCTAR